MGKMVCAFLVLSVISIIAATPALDKREDYYLDDSELVPVLFKRSISKRDDDIDFEEEEFFTAEEDKELDIKKRSPPNCEKECGYKFRPYCGFASECEYNCEKKQDPNVRCAKPENA